MKKVFKTLAIAASAALCFCSCDNTEKIYTGNDAPVFFGKNEAIILISENDSHVDLAVNRLNADAALTIGINVLEKSDELEIPASIKFEAGQSETVVRVSFPANTQPGTSYTFDVELKGADPFLENGDANFSAIIANPERIQARTTPYYTIDQIGEWYTEVLKISDRLWILPNFWNSGVDVTLTGTEVVGDGDILLDISASKGYHDTYDDNGEIYDEWWLYEGDEPIILYPHGKDADLQMEGGFFYNPSNKEGGNFSFYKPSTKRIEIEFDFEMFRQATGWVYDVTNFEFFSLRMGETALADFQPYLPEYKAPGASVPVKAYLKSAPETVYNWTGYWDPEDEYSFVMDKGESQFNYYNTVTFTLDKNTLAISKISGAAVSYDTEYKCYSFNDYFYFGGKYFYGWIYDQEADTKYDYDKNTFSFSFAYGDIDDANDYHDDVLILELQEN